MMGLIFSAFSWTYAFAQVPGGIVLDRFGTRFVYSASLVLWSFFTLLQGLAHNLWSLLAYRLGLGLAEAPCFPANSRILASWFPQAERARATSVYAVGQYFGLAFLSPVLFWISAAFGWRWLFVIAGGLGIAYGLFFYRFYRDPSQSRRVNQAELDHIRAGGGLDHGESVGFSWAAVRELMSKRQILGASIGQFAGNSTLVFFITWFPTYLADGARSRLDQVRLLRGHALHRRLGRRSDRRPCLGLAHPPNRLRQSRAQAADRRRSVPGLDDHRGQLCRQQRAGDRDHVAGLLRPGNGQPWAGP